MELIDRKALINQLKEENIPFNADINEIINIQPIVFDTEKVVEQLEERTLNSKSAQTEAIIGMCGASANYYHGEADAYINAIDIVKKGGVK